MTDVHNVINSDINILHNNDHNNLISKNNILIQMLQKQRKGLPYKLRLDIDDIKRIVYNINYSPFSETECCIWNGYVTDNDISKTKYINFYFKHHKIALHRLLYINYIDDLNNNNYLKFICKNKGICCNVTHIEKSNNNSLIKHNNIDLKEKIVVPITENHNNKPNKINNIQVIKLHNDNTNNTTKTSNNERPRKFIVVFD